MSKSILQTPIKIGDLYLPNRIIMAPLTRCRSDDDRNPTDLNAEYYKQRASAGLIVAEGTCVLANSIGYPNTPGIWTGQQIQGWKKITDAVHGAGGLIISQLWHVGRVSDPIYLNGEPPAGPSSVLIDKRIHVTLIKPERPYVLPRALELQEIQPIIEGYRQAAVNAKLANFDGIQIHCGNGYLLDQFLQDKTNRRTDIYGGSIENRARLLLEITDAVISIWGPGRVGVNFSPRGDYMDMSDSNPKALFTYVARELAKRNVAFIYLREYVGEDSLLSDIKKAFGGIVIINENLSQNVAENLIQTGQADAAAFGKLFIANPDLVERFANNETLNEPIPEYFYINLYSESRDLTKGYTDYPVLSQQLKS